MVLHIEAVLQISSIVFSPTSKIAKSFLIFAISIFSASSSSFKLLLTTTSLGNIIVQLFSLACCKTFLTTSNLSISTKELPIL